MPLNFVGKKKAAPEPETKAKTTGLKFGNKSASSAGKTVGKTTTSKDDDDDNSGKGVVKNATKKNSAVAGLNFLKKGAAAKQAFENEEAKQAAKAAEAGKMFRFWMKPGEDRTITFLDGELSDDGLLDVVNYYDHQVKVNGEWKNFVCTADVDTSQPCPICEKGDSKPTLVALLTVVDHTAHTIQNGEKAGQVIQHTRKLFACKMKTLKALNKIAAKRGGLTGCTFDVSRTGDKEPNVGNNFDFTKKWDMDDFQAEYELDDEGISPADYQEEITFTPVEELLKLGVGKSFSGVGTKKNVNKKDLADQM